MLQPASYKCACVNSGCVVLSSGGGNSHRPPPQNGRWLVYQLLAWFRACMPWKEFHSLQYILLLGQECLQLCPFESRTQEKDCQHSLCYRIITLGHRLFWFLTCLQESRFVSHLGNVPADQTQWRPASADKEKRGEAGDSQPATNKACEFRLCAWHPWVRRGGGGGCLLQ